MSETPPLITFIGAGNMGSALLGGLIAKGHPPALLLACDPSSEKLARLENLWGLGVSSDNKAAAAEKADVLILAVKPQQLASIAKELAPSLQKKRPLILSIAAGVSLDSLASWLGSELPIIRSMPNIAALVSSGATGLYGNPFVSEKQRSLAENILNSVGITVWVAQEKDLDTITALSGSGPAYFFLVMEALQAGAEALGLPPAIAKRLTLQTAYGAARLAQASEESLAVLRERVTSPAGTTASALAVLENGKLRELFKAALCAALKRAQELSQSEEKH